MIHKNPDQRKGWLMMSKWTNEYFARIGLIPGNWLFYNVMYEYELEHYITRQKEKAQKKHKNQVERYKRLGKNYYDEKRVAQMKASQAYKKT